MDQLGQMLMIGVDGMKMTREIQEFLRKSSCGGVILFARNIRNLKQMMRFIKELRDAAGRQIIVGVDQEGGRVARLNEPFTKLPPMATVGRACMESDEIAFAVGRLLGRELGAAGFNIDFAPVLDVATNAFNPVIGDRAFASDPQMVARIGSAFIRGMQGEGVAACGKHFPGHGDTDVDSHVGLPVLESTRQRFESCELIPFRAAVQAGVAAIMTAHLMTPNIDAEAPATISKKITHDMLRTELGFNGLIFTDDLTMKGMTRIYPPHESAWRAIAAGADIAMICEGLQEAQKAGELLRRAAGEGWIGEREIAATVKRIAEFKSRYCGASTQHPPMSVIGCREHAGIVKRLTAAGKTNNLSRAERVR